MHTTTSNLPISALKNLKHKNRKHAEKKVVSKIASLVGMESISTFTFFIFLILIVQPTSIGAKIFMVLLDGDSVFSYRTMQATPSEDDVEIYKRRMSRSHDMLLESLLRTGSYTKLYSYTHLLNGFAVHVTSDDALDVLMNAEGVRAIQEDLRMEKLTTYSPEYLEIPSGVWPVLGGAESSGEGVVIGLIDTGINPYHPSFRTKSSTGSTNHIHAETGKFKGKCVTGDKFPLDACNGKIVGAQYFARSAIAAGEFNATRDCSSPFDADGHGSHTASTAAGNHQVPVIANNFNYGYASGMAPGARVSIYKAMYAFGGFMSDVVAAVDQAVEDGVDVLSLSIGPSSVPSGPAAFLNVLEMQLLFATRAGVPVIQAAGNSGPSTSSILSFSPWIVSVAASITDRKYRKSITLGNGQSFTGAGLAPPTAGEVLFPVAAAAHVSHRNGFLTVESCQDAEQFILYLVQGKLIICRYNYDFEFGTANIAKIAYTIHKIGAAGFILTVDPDIGPGQIKSTTVSLPVPGIVLNDMQASSALWNYYNLNTVRGRGKATMAFSATARISDGRQAVYTGQAPIVASYSSRGPDINNALLQTADVLKPNIMAPGSSIWAAWSPTSEGDQNIRGQYFAVLSGTSMAAPHIAGVAALIKQKYPHWSPSAITSAMMTTANVTSKSGATMLAQQKNQLTPANPFDFGAGFINPARAIDPGLVFNTYFEDYIEFLCAVPQVDDMSVRRAIGVGCPTKRKEWCSDLNLPSVTISNLVGSRKVIRRVTNVSDESEIYKVFVREPKGVNITVIPSIFKISVDASRIIKLALEATNKTNAYTFGEVILQGSRNHVVRVPIAVYVSSSIG